jgi:ubiquinone/menaquinone biosynthesis C-methylase UbiE
MKPIVLRPNAVPVYGFLSHIQATREDPGVQAGKKVLDCGAGGPVPPLAVFHQQGFAAWGIDLSREQLAKAKAFCGQHGMGLHLHQGDMRHIPFRDAAFDYVYEHYSMCHLSKVETAQTVQEMHRVLKPGGLCLVGVISEETWPTLGRESDSGEFWIEEDGERVLHSVFTDEEAERLLDGWQIVQKETRIQESRERLASLSPQDWMQRYGTFYPACSAEEWQALYDQRTSLCRYVHIYYLLRKPTSEA